MKKKGIKTLFLIVCFALTTSVLFTAACTTKALTYSGSALTAGTVGVAYETSVKTAIGSDTVKYDLKPGSSLPKGLSFNDGVITGTPEVAVANSTFTVVADTDGFDSAEATFTITINSGALAYTGTALTAKVGEEYTGSAATVSGVSGVTYTLKTGSNMPSGLEFANGAITGIPAVTVINHSFIVVASAANYADKEATFTISIGVGTLAYTGTAFTAKVGEEYIGSVATVSGVSGVTYTLKTGSNMPSGLEFANGAITGIPAVTVINHSFIVVASAANYADKEATFTITVEAGVLSYTGARLASGIVGETYSGTVATASGSTGPAITYALKMGSNLPAGLTFTNGVIGGAPTIRITDVMFTVIASAANYADKEATFVISVINAGELDYSGSTLTAAIIDRSYSASVATATATGNPTIAYALKSGNTLPAGLIFANGAISGTPTAKVEGASFIVIASAVGYNPVEATFTISVTTAGLISYSAAPLATATTGTAYSANITTATATGNPSPTIAYAIKSGNNLPAGLTFSNGTISGTPTATGTTTFTVIASASGYDSVEALFSITVMSPTLYTFEAEYVDLTEKTGAGPSNVAYETEMIIANPSASNGYFIGFTNRRNLFFEFVITSNAATVGEFSIALASDYGENMFGPTLLDIKVGSETLSYSAITLGHKTFNTYTLGKINLSAGSNTIRVTILENEYYNGGTGGPLIDFITISTAATLSWNPVTSNIE